MACYDYHANVNKYLNDSIDIRSRVNINTNNTGSSSAGQAGQIAGSIFSGIMGIAVAGAIAKSQQTQATNAALAQAKATISTCNTQINTIRSEISTDYDVNVNAEGKVVGETLAKKKSNIEGQIKDLKNTYGIEGDGA